VDALLEFVTAHNGALPRRKSEDSVESSLGETYKKLKAHCAYQMSTHFSVKMLQWFEWDRMQYVVDEMYARWNRQVLQEDAAERGRRSCNSSSSRATDLPKSGLIIKLKWLDLILSGQKTWEIRSTATTKREVVALIESGSGHVLGQARITDSVVLSLTDLQNNVEKHCIQDLSTITYAKSHAWVLTETLRFKVPQPYEHPQGAIVWVDMGSVALRKVPKSIQATAA
jgi:hypothetical protein